MRTSRPPACACGSKTTSNRQSGLPRPVSCSHLPPDLARIKTIKIGRVQFKPVVYWGCRHDCQDSRIVCLRFAGCGEQIVLTQRKLKESRVLATGGGFDFQIGQRLRGLRVARGLSQTEVATKVNLSFQQIQKYESGKSSVSAAKLCALALALEIPVSFFFDECPPAGHPSSGTSNGLSEEAWLLAGQFDRIKNRKTRAQVLALVKCLAEE